MPVKEFDIYIVLDTQYVTCVPDPMHRVILDYLSAGPASLTDMMNDLVIPQSTLSVQISRLVDMKLVRSDTDPRDNRRKTISLASLHFAASLPPGPDLDGPPSVMIRRLVEAPGGCREYLLGSILEGLQSVRFDVSPWMRRIGYQAGTIMAERMGSMNGEEGLEFLKGYFLRNGLGNMNVETHLPLTVSVRETREIPGFTGRQKAAFCGGMISAVMNSCLDRRCRPVSCIVSEAGDAILTFECGPGDEEGSADAKYGA